MTVISVRSAILGLLLAAAVQVHPARALDQKQYANVCTEFLGLRSASARDDVNGAGYGMDDGNTSPMNCLKGAPANRDTALKSTLERIKGFEDSSTRYLLLVDRCPGQARDYEGAFPKCNKVGGKVIAATDKTLSDYKVDDLISWVNKSIP